MIARRMFMLGEGGREEKAAGEGEGEEVRRVRSASAANGGWCGER